MHKVTIYLTDELYADLERVTALRQKRDRGAADGETGRQRVMREALAVGLRELSRAR